MSKKLKSTQVYKHPFCKGYWRDAAAELKDTKMLVFAALIVALRVALKTLVRIPLGPSLDITPAFLANALGAMVYGPVVGAIGALVSDVLGVVLRGDTYFLPYALTEIAGTMVFSLFFYRQKISTLRVILSRFTICLCVNILLQTPIDMLYNYVMLGKSAMVLTLPRILKNLFMFPLESVALALFLNAIQPFTYRMKLTHVKSDRMSFEKKQIVVLLVLVLVGIASVFGYLFVHYDNTSLSASYSAEDRREHNRDMQVYIIDGCDDYDDVATLTVVESAYKEFLGHEITYTVAVFQVAEGAEVTDAMWGYSKTPASKDENLTRIGTATIVVDENTGEVVSLAVKPAE